MKSEIDALDKEPSLPGVRTPKEAAQYIKARKYFRAAVTGILEKHGVKEGNDSKTSKLVDRRSAAIRLLMEKTLEALPRALRQLDEGSEPSVAIAIAGSGPLVKHDGRALLEDPAPDEWVYLDDAVVRDIASYFKAQLIEHYGVKVSEKDKRAADRLVVELEIRR